MNTKKDTGENVTIQNMSQDLKRLIKTGLSEQRMGALCVAKDVARTYLSFMTINAQSLKMLVCVIDWWITLSQLMKPGAHRQI
jgi:hypothetical protein